MNWTPEQYWEYVGGLAGDFERDQMRAMMAEFGLSITSQPQRPADALRLLADLFAESVHETWTRGEIVNVIEDAIRLGSSHARPDEGGRLTFCERCNANRVHRRTTVIDGVQMFECPVCAGARPDYCTASGEAYCKSVAGRVRCSRCPLSRPERNPTENIEGGA